MKVKLFYKKHLYAFWFTIVGLIAGYLYYYFIGCLSGTCPLKQLWYYDTAVGGILGLIIGDAIDNWIKKRKLKQKKTETNENN